MGEDLRAARLGTLGDALIYNEAVADEIFSRLATYAVALGDLRQRLSAIA